MVVVAHAVVAHAVVAHAFAKEPTQTPFVEHLTTPFVGGKGFRLSI